MPLETLPAGPNPRGATQTRPAPVAPDPDDTPITDAAFAACMAPLGPFHAARDIAVAVSGGPDSLCLAWLAARWGNPLALIVDHGLRAESGQEAELTAARLAGFGVPSRILRLRLPPGPGLAARARHARYAALLAACEAAGRLDLLLGHHRADQAETRRIRALSRSGPDGLAGMAAVVEQDRVRLLRPLLGMAPARLRATLAAAGLAWVTDPGNRDTRALRNRLRLSLDAAQIAAEAAACTRDGAARAQRDAEIAAILAERVDIRPEGFAILSPGPLPAPALAALWRALAGNPYPPPRDAIARLAEAPRPATLAGLRLAPAGRLGPGWLLLREAAALSAPIPARAGAVWDRRFRLEGLIPPESSAGLHIAAAGPLPRVRRTLPACIAETLPALWANATLAAVPHLGYCFATGLERVRFVFAPPSPAAGAPFAAAFDGGAVRANAPHLRREANAAGYGTRGPRRSED